MSPALTSMKGMSESVSIGDLPQAPWMVYLAVAKALKGVSKRFSMDFKGFSMDFY